MWLFPWCSMLTLRAGPVCKNYTHSFHRCYILVCVCLCSYVLCRVSILWWNCPILLFLWLHIYMDVLCVVILCVSSLHSCVCCIWCCMRCAHIVYIIICCVRLSCVVVPMLLYSLCGDAFWAPMLYVVWYVWSDCCMCFICVHHAYVYVACGCLVRLVLWLCVCLVALFASMCA